MCVEVIRITLEYSFKRPGPSHDPLLCISNSRQSDRRVSKAGLDELVLVIRAVLKLIKEHMAISLADRVARDMT